MSTVKVKRATVTINGTTYQTKDTEVEPGGLMPDGIEMSDQGQLFHQEIHSPSTVTTTIIASSQTDLLAIKQTRNAVINIEWDAGIQYVITGGIPEGDVRLANGEIPTTFRGNPMEAV